MGAETGWRSGSKGTRESLSTASVVGQDRAELYEFGPFRLEPAERKLSQNGEPVALTPKVFDTLVLLVRNGGHLVEKDELLRTLWPDSFVEEGNLTNNIFVLRKALGEDSQYIETIPKRGYRFVGAVRQLPSPQTRHQTVSAGAESEAAGNTAPSALLLAGTPRARFLPFRRPVLLAVATLLVGGLGTVSFLLIKHRLGSESSPASDRKVLRTVPFTTASGNAILPAFSPDGREIAFIWDGSNRMGYDVYVQLVGAELPLRLTYHRRGNIGLPGWSPDGNRIAFERCDGKQDGVYVVPALGGEEREVSPTRCPYMPSDVVWEATVMRFCLWTNAPPGGHTVWSTSHSKLAKSDALLQRTQTTATGWHFLQTHPPLRLEGRQLRYAAMSSLCQSRAAQ